MTTTKSNAGYAGDLDVREAWELLKSEPAAQLIDVRTAAEWAFVGQPDLSSLGRRVQAIEWQSFPAMAINPGFTEAAAGTLNKAGATKDTPVLFLCRSGARSRAAAIALTNAGFTRAYNISGGFEGDADASGHRGRKNGWKAANLPWRQS
ncbi:MAG: rhodanese-like domain-containing protein [Rhizomicrobium sp.]